MRFLVTTLLAAMLLSVGPAMAQTGDIVFTATVEPEQYVFDQKAYAHDENGERIRGDDGRYQLEPQFITLIVEATMDCNVAPDGATADILAAGPRSELKNASTGEVLSTYLDLDPRTLNLSWVQEEPLGPWSISESIPIRIISDGIPQTTIEGNYTWHLEKAGIPQACFKEETMYTANPATHLVIVPGFDFDPADYDIDEDEEETNGIPGPGPLAAIAAVGLAVALRRRD